MRIKETHRGARSWLDQSFFVEAPLPPRLTGERVLASIGCTLAMVLIQLARMWPSAPLNSIWAEDGSTWLTDALHRGFLDALSTPYDGYLQSLSRILATPIAALPAQRYAVAMALAGALTVTGCALLVWRASAGYIEPAPLRAALSALVVLVPVADAEVLANVTNAIWFVLFATFWLLLWRPRSLAGSAGVAALLFLAALTNIGVAILGPLWLLRAIAVRDRRDGVIVAGFAAGLLLQLSLSFHQLNLSGETGVTQGSLSPHWDWDLLPAYLQRVVGGGLAGDSVAGLMWRRLGAVAEVAFGLVLAGLLWTSLRSAHPRRRLLVPLTIAVSLALFLLTGYRRWQSGGSQFLWPHGSSGNGFGRYMIVPSLLVLSALMICLGSGVTSATRRRSASLAIAGLVVLLALFSFTLGNPALRGRPTWTQALDSQRRWCSLRPGAEARVPVAPPTIPGAFSLQLSCHKLGS